VNLCDSEQDGKDRCHRRSGQRFFEFRRQLDDKARLYGASVVVADRWFPSGKTCSCFVAGLADSWRIGTATLAKNPERLAASSAVSACREARSGAVRKSRVKGASEKQEPNGASQLCAA
jgi:putative transposase